MKKVLDGNDGTKISTNGGNAESLLIVFYGFPLKKDYFDLISENEKSATKKVYIPYTDSWTLPMGQKRLTKEMDKYYQLTKQDLLDAKTIDIVAHSYGPIKALAFLHAIAKDKENAPKILAKVKNLHLYNGLINTDRDENHRFTHNIKVFIFKIRIFFMSLLRGEKDVKMPDVVKSLIDLKSDTFQPAALITYNPKDGLAPSSTPFMEQVQGELKKAGVLCGVKNDSRMHRYFVQEGDNYNHSTGSGIVERFERTEERVKKLVAKSSGIVK